MGLETPLALLGLLTAAIPWLAHRMRKRELPRVSLPTFPLLARAAAISRKSRTLTDLLLLALRIGLLSVASFALAAPYVERAPVFGDGRARSVAIVIDDSLSMSRLQGGRTLLAEATAQARAAIDGLGTGSEVAVLLAGKPARVLLPLTFDLAAATERLAAIPPRGVRAGALADAVALAARALSRARLPGRHLLLLSDFARHNELDPAALQAPGAALVARRIGAPDGRGNAFIHAVSSARDPEDPRRSLVSAEVRTHGAVPEPLRVSLQVDAAVRDTKTVTLRDGRGEAVLATPNDAVTPDTLGHVRLHTSDALDADNEALVLMEQSGATRVLLVNGDPHPASDADELHYLSRALEIAADAGGAMAITATDARSLESAGLENHDVVVLANVGAPRPDAARALVQFVAGGGGLIVTGGHHVDAAAYNAALGAVLPGRLVSTDRTDGVGYAERYAAGFLPDGLAGLRSARSHTRLVLEGDPSGTLLEFADGLPAIASRAHGEGRCILIATALDADDSDLPLRPGYLPLVAALVRHAAGAAPLSATRVDAGDGVTLRVPAGAGALGVTKPDATTRSLTIRAGEAHFSETDQLGLYRVTAVRAGKAASATVARFVVGAPHRESDLTPGPVPMSASAEAASAGVRVHKPVAPVVLLLAFALALAEGFARLKRRPATRAPAAP